jgi:glycosyltransferase involved in cell wall biosynthesis
VTDTRNATIYYAGFAFRGGGAFMHAQLARTELQRAGWGVELITLESLPWPIRYLPHVVSKVLNWFISPMGFHYKERLTRFLYKRFFDRDAQLRIFENVNLSWNSSVPSLTLLHAVWSDNLQSISADAAAVTRLVRAEEKVIDSITHPIITVSEKYRDFLLGTHSRSRRLHHIAVVPLGLDLAEFDVTDQPQHSAKSLVFCGGLEARKNLRFLLGVFRQLLRLDGQYRLTIIGDGPDRGDLEWVAIQHALPVTFHGHLNRTDVIRELRLHSVYVHPSVKESFSFALLEAKLAGLTTVAYKGLEVPSEFIDVPVPSFDEGDWLAAILSADDALSKEISADVYSSRRMMQDTLNLAFGVAERTL